MRRSIIFAVFLMIPGCANPETDPLVPGNRCEIVPWAKSVKRTLPYAEFYDQGGPLTKLRSQTWVIVVEEAIRRRKMANATEQVLVKVLNGPLEGHVGFVFRAHLRKRSGPIPKPEKPKEIEEAPPAVETEEVPSSESQ